MWRDYGSWLYKTSRRGEGGGGGGGGEEGEEEGVESVAIFIDSACI